MKKISIILVMLFWCNVGFANELFGIKLGDDVKYYNVKKLSETMFEIKPKIRNPDFELYQIETTLKNKIHTIRAKLKESFNSKEVCLQKMKDYVDIINNRLEQIHDVLDLDPTHKWYLNKKTNQSEMHLWGLCPEYNNRYSGHILLKDFTAEKDISKEGL
jgi:DNA polymerase II small subunit/DNA polymerase delta subunit B